MDFEEKVKSLKNRHFIISKEIPGLISFRMDWLDLLAVQGTLKSLLQHHSSKASILWRSPSFTVQLSHPYMTTGKTIALTTRTFVGKVMSLLLNMLSMLVITFLLISWLQSPSAVNQIEDGKYRLRTRFLEHRPVISPPTNQEKVCTQWRIMKTGPLPKWWTSLSCFWNFHGWAESSELIFRHKSAFSPGCWAPR